MADHSLHHAVDACAAWHSQVGAVLLSGDEYIEEDCKGKLPAYQKTDALQQLWVLLSQGFHPHHQILLLLSVRFLRCQQVRLLLLLLHLLLLSEQLPVIPIPSMLEPPQIPR